MTTPESSADSTPDMTAAELALGVLALFGLRFTPW